MKKTKKHMSSPDPKRGHHVINNGVKDIYPDILKRFVDIYSKAFFGSNNYKNLGELGIMNEHGLPVDCVLGVAPLLPNTHTGIQNSTVYAPGREKHTNYGNAVKFGLAKLGLLTRVNILMHDICTSLRDRKEMPNDLDEKMGELRQFISDKFNRDVFVDEQAKGWWEKERGRGGAKRLEDWTQEVERMLIKIAGEDNIQLVIHWGQWAFRVAQGFKCSHVKSKVEY